MKSTPFLLPAAATAILCAVPGMTQDVEIDADGCEVIRIGKDGRETRTMPKGASGSDAGSARASSASVRSGSGSTRSSVSLSASSRGGGTSRASSVSSTTDANGRTITTRSDENGCTITIDDRGAKGE